MSDVYRTREVSVKHVDGWGFHVRDTEEGVWLRYTEVRDGKTETIVDLCLFWPDIADKVADAIKEVAEHIRTTEND